MTEEKKVLLIDDPHPWRDTTAAEVAASGYQVHIAEDSKTAVNLLEAEQYDVVVTELWQPEADGFEVLKKTKSAKNSPCVIILTGNRDISAVIDALRLGADDYLLKPCYADDLLFRIARCLAKKNEQKLLKMYECILSICAVCKKIRDDREGPHGAGKWVEFENYILRRSNAQISHGYCPACYEKAASEIAKVNSS